MADIDLAYRAMAGHDPNDGWSSPRPLDAPDEDIASTIGVVKQWMVHPTSSHVRDAFDRFLNEVRSRGFEVVEIDEPSLSTIPESFLASGHEILEIHADRFAEHRDRYGADTQIRLDQCKRGTINDVLEARRWRAAAQNTIDRLDRDGIELLASPTVGAQEKLIGIDDMSVDGDRYAHREVLAPFTAPINHIGVPALAAPIARSAGLPVSVQLIAPSWREARLLTVAARLEDADVFGTATPPRHSD